MDTIRRPLGEIYECFRTLQHLKAAGAFAKDNEIADSVDLTLNFLQRPAEIFEERRQEIRKDCRLKKEGHQVWEIVGGPQVVEEEDSTLRYVESTKIGEVFAGSPAEAEAPIRPVFEDEEELSCRTEDLQETIVSVSVESIDYEQWTQGIDRSGTAMLPGGQERKADALIDLDVLEPILEGVPDAEYSEEATLEDLAAEPEEI